RARFEYGTRDPVQAGVLQVESLVTLSGRDRRGSRGPAAPANAARTVGAEVHQRSGARKIGRRLCRPARAHQRIDLLEAAALAECERIGALGRADREWRQAAG